MNVRTKRKKWTWSEFAGQSKRVLEKQIERVLKNYRIPFTKNTFILGRVQSLFLGGGNSGTVYRIRDLGEVKIYILPAFADPITRVVFTFTGTEEKIKRMKRISVIKVDYDNQTKKMLRNVLRDINKKLEKPLWNINHHPRFQTGVLLSQRVKWKWKKWLAK